MAATPTKTPKPPATPRRKSDQAKHWSGAHTGGLFLAVILIVVFGMFTYEATKVYDESDVFTGEHQTPWTWYAILVSLFLFVVIAGHGICGRFAGFAIDARNKMTLSRLQLILWTVLILSSYLTVVLARLGIEGMNPDVALKVGMPEELWFLMGISVTSMVGSPLLLSDKKKKKPNNAERIHTLGILRAEVGGQPDNQGTVVVNASPQEARISELFRGDETGNAAHLDIGKVQMFFFTLVLILAYFMTIQGGLPGLIVGAGADSEGVVFLPPLNESMIALLGISHAGYLSYKAVPHSQQDPS